MTATGRTRLGGIEELQVLDQYDVYGIPDLRQGIVETLTLTGVYLLTLEYNVFEIF